MNNQQAQGLHPELTAIAKGNKMDKHPLTSDQANIEGIPRDQVHMQGLTQ